MDYDVDTIEFNLFMVQWWEITLGERNDLGFIEIGESPCPIANQNAHIWGHGGEFFDYLAHRLHQLQA